MTEKANTTMSQLKTSDGISQNGNSNNKAFLITELPHELKPYNVSDDEYFDYEKQHREIMKRKKKKENSDYCSPQSRLPSISMRLLDEAINMHILPQDKREKLIRNPNKYSIFFCKFNTDSPSMRSAMAQKKLNQQDLVLSSFEQFAESFAANKQQGQQQKQEDDQQEEDEVMDYSPKGSINQDYLKKLIEYLQYVTEHYQKLKELLTLRSNIKRRPRPDMIKSQSSGDLSMKLGQGSQTMPNRVLAMSSVSSFHINNNSPEKILVTLENQAERQRIRSMKEESALERYVNITLEQHSKKEKEFQDQILELTQRLKKTKKDKEVQIKKKQEQDEKKLAKVFERGRYLQEQKEEKIINKFKKMDEQFEKALQRKQQHDQEREEMMKANNVDSKLFKIKEKNELRENRQLEEREQLIRQIETKQYRSMQMMNSHMSMHFHKIEAQRDKYHSTLGQIEKQEEKNEVKLLQDLMHNHLDIQEKMDNKKKQLALFYKTRAKEEKKKHDLHARVKERLEYQEEKAFEKAAADRLKQEEKLEILSKLAVQKQTEKHKRYQISLRRVKSNLDQVRLQLDDKQVKILEKSVELTEKRQKLKDSLEIFKNSSRSLHLELSQRKQDLLLRL